MNARSLLLVCLSVLVAGCQASFDADTEHGTPTGQFLFGAWKWVRLGTYTQACAANPVKKVRECPAPQRASDALLHPVNGLCTKQTTPAWECAYCLAEKPANMGGVVVKHANEPCVWRLARA